MKTIILLVAALSVFSACSAEDLLIVLNKDEATAWLIEPATGEAVAKVAVGEGPHEAAVSPDGRKAVVCNYGAGSDGNTLSVIDIEKRTVVKTIRLGPYTRPHGIQYFSDGRHVLVTSETTGKLVKVNIEEGAVVAVFESGGDSHMVLLNRGGTTAYSTSIQAGLLGVTRLDEEAGGTSVVSTGSGTEAIALRPDEAEVWVALNRANELTVVDLETMNVTAEIECGWFPIRLAFTPDGSHVLATGMLSGDLIVIDASTRTIVRRVALGDFVLKESDWVGLDEPAGQALVDEVVERGPRPIGILIDPDGQYAYVANRGLNHIAVVDLKSWEVVKRIQTGAGPDGMAWSRLR